jgi:hypothetical protein
MASCTYPQQRQVLYAPYQSRSMIMEPRQRGHVRGSVVFMKGSSSLACIAQAHSPPAVEDHTVPDACGVS